MEISDIVKILPFFSFKKYNFRFLLDLATGTIRIKLGLKTIFRYITKK